MKFDTILENKSRGSMDWTIPKGWEMNNDFQFYVEGGSVQKGTKLKLKGATNKSMTQTCFLRIFRLGWYSGSGARKVYHSGDFSVEPGVTWNINSNSKQDLFQNGPSWPCLFELEIPQDWCDGLYVVKIENEKWISHTCSFLAHGATGGRGRNRLFFAFEHSSKELVGRSKCHSDGQW